MKVTGENFSFHHKRKRTEEVRYQKYQNFQAKGTVTGQNSGVVKRGHSSFHFPAFHLREKVKCAPVLQK